MDLSKHVTLNSEIEKLQPITLLYELQVPEIPEPVDASAMPQIKADSAAFLEALLNKHEGRVDAYKGWQKERNERIVRERRVRAPGYDGLLEPKRKG